MKKNIGLTLLLIVFILTAAFYLTRGTAWISFKFIAIWVGAFVVMHLVITPLVVSIVRSRDQKKAALEEAAKKQVKRTSKE
ncbi:hypothetical protein ACFQ22_04865 [Lentilactobacillus raoultii]|uniref:Uncharacterized protein n=1 Tax=Lentilactobacillus raoultii TaxID=1987503 RepID=A0ABW3PQU8_9LACO|nr:hypothetical protein [Lentilactobacillus raoultii]